MVNSQQFIKRLEEILSYYDISAAVFADTIGVQRSSISHLLSGRNKPSLEFVMKVVQAYPDINLYWLLNGRGTFPPNPSKTESPILSKEKEIAKIKDVPPTLKKIQRIIIFYTDGSFSAHENGEITSVR